MLKEEEILELEKIVKKENSSLFIIFFIIFLITILFITVGYYFRTAELDIIAVMSYLLNILIFGCLYIYII